MHVGSRRRDGAHEGERLAFNRRFRRFVLRGFEGRVSVSSGVNRDPRQTDFDLLELPFDLALTPGYPTLRAVITYAGSGYRAYMGWIQLVTNRDPAAGGATRSVDMMPIQAGVDSPFVTYSSAPTFFAAPANLDHETEDWHADALLVACPDVARTRRVAAPLGRRWGDALRERRPSPLPLASAGSAVRDEHPPLFARAVLHLGVSVWLCGHALV